MDDLLNRLIEVDKSARAMVKSAKEANAKVMSELEERKQALKAENEAKFVSMLAKERDKQNAALEKVKKNIESRQTRLMNEFDRMYEREGGNWVDTIVQNVINGV